MLKNPMVRCAFRLFTLGVMLGAFAFLVSNERVKAGTIEECDRDFGYCLYGNCLTTSGPDYVECRDGCDTAYEVCRFDDPYDPLPAPFPVVFNYTQCHDNCLDCLSLPVEERYNCYSPCKSYCLATYGQ